MSNREFKEKLPNKKFKVTSLTAAALASVLLAGAGFNGEVKAANVDSGTESKAKTPVENAQDNVASTKKDVSDKQAALDKAKGAAKDPDEDYSKQEAAVKKAEGDAKDKAEAYKKAQAETEAAKKLRSLVQLMRLSKMLLMQVRKWTKLMQL
ncbi:MULTISPECIES: hypothetical protein [Lactobacillus]|uniref:Uncharacterized protein n=1 Tax=Lactobacillus xujianguonis TaxID=2495899 RepID=A0A437STA4_9LACO|nr:MULTISPECIES: hypothetical protein [Lactobacillus]RVU70077.1 hypothetical protein EJK17_09620 [Lactobacillus xujianguonis]RVU77656.1 hypothetical protein EJK20_00110 [Lactobacillus xujianguonis]